MDDKPLLRTFPIHPELAGLVWRISGYEERGHALSGSVEMASLVVPLIISFGEPFNVALGRAPGPNECWGSFVAGLTLDPAFIGSTGRAEAVQIDFSPLGAQRFFGSPMGDLAGRMVTLDEFGDREILQLRQRLGEMRLWEHRFELIENFVLERVRRNGPGQSLAAQAYERLAGSDGQVRITTLASTFDCSRKHLAQSFRSEFGLPAKSIARIMRFENVLRTVGVSDTFDWADIALACGFADQAHLAREFVQLGGTRPTQWRRSSRSNR